MRDRFSQLAVSRGGALAKIVLALLVAFGGSALISGAAAGSSPTPVAYTSLHLDQPGATLTVPGWTDSAPGCVTGQPSLQQTFDAALSSASGGTGQLTLSFSSLGGSGSVAALVNSSGAHELQFDLTGEPGAGTIELDLSGYGTTFTGSVQLSDPSCTYTSSSATLTLDGTGLTIIGVDVSLALNPDAVNVCSSSCSSVLATATVTDSTSGQPVAGQSMSFSSSDPDVKIGPVTDHGDGTYTVSVEPSDEPGDVTITASDDSVTPAATGTATLYQVCSSDTASSDVQRVGADQVAVDTRHCTTTTVKCLRADNVILRQRTTFTQVSPTEVPAFDCYVTVTDVNKDPSPPTGYVEVDITSFSTLPLGESNIEGCDLEPHPPAAALCMESLLFDPGPWEVNADYPGDPLHKPSTGQPASFTVGPAGPYKNKLKDILADTSGAFAAESAFGGIPLAAYGGTPGAVLAGTFTSLAYSTDWLSKHLKDPPDPAYRSVLRPRRSSMPRVSSAATPMARFLGALLSNAKEFRAVSQVLPTTLNRAVTAGKAGDVKARTMQITAAVNYLDQLAGLMAKEITLQESLAGLFRSTARDMTNDKQVAALKTAAAAVVSPRLIRSERDVEDTMLAVSADPAPHAFPKLPAAFP